VPDTRDIIVIGSSAGGVQALQHLVAGLPGDFPAAVFIVQHTWPTTGSYLAEILARKAILPVSAAQNGVRHERGHIYVAPADFHLFVERGYLRVLRGPKENRARPAINPLFRSAALAYGPRVIGVLLTGTLDDGTAGLWTIKQSGGVALAQSDALYPDMPEHARANVALDHFVPLAEIPPLLVQLNHEPLATNAVPAPLATTQLSDRSAKLDAHVGDLLEQIGQRSYFSCPECNGALWELKEGALQYRCHVGHAYSAATLRACQDNILEGAMWTALRSLKESAKLDERLAAEAANHDLDDAAARHRNNADDKLTQAQHLEQFLASLRSSTTP